MFRRQGRERGAVLVEYVLGVAFFAMVAAGAINAFGDAIEADLVSVAGSGPLVGMPADDGADTSTPTTVPVTTTTVPAPKPVEITKQTFDAADAGTVTVEVEGDVMRLVEVDAKQKWTHDVRVETDEKIVVRFEKNKQVVTITITVSNGEAHAIVATSKA